MSDNNRHRGITNITMMPQYDGVDHINVYSKGRTELGRLLSNFEYSTIDTPDGPFNSLEGYYHYLKFTRSIEVHLAEKGDLANIDSYRVNVASMTHYWGGLAKRSAKSIRGILMKAGIHIIDTPDDEFNRKFNEGLLCKIKRSPKLQELIKNNELPYVHYYSYGDGDSFVIVYKDYYMWLPHRIYEVIDKL